MKLKTTINGKAYSAEIEERTFLLDFLRDEIGLTGAKRSCDVQICGTCTILIDRKPFSSCSVLAYEIEGKEVLTIEGVADHDGLHPIQQAFIDEYGFQCGYCTSGMVLTTIALLEENPNPDEQIIRSYLNGNLCRCTGYYPILKSIKHAVELINNENAQ